MDQQTMLKVENIYAGYSASKVLAGVSLEIKAGTLVALIGAQRSRQNHDNARHLRDYQAL